VEIRSLLRTQLQQAHGLLDEVVADCPAEVLHGRGDGWTIKSIAHIYAHTIYGEDALVHGLVQGKPPLFHAGGWAGRIGVTMSEDPKREPDWSAGAPLDLGLLREYGAAVYAATDVYVAGASDEELARVFDPGFLEQQSVAQFVSTALVWHVTNHQGEIAALKGVLGLKGLPF
jgi:hypothetical protein